MFALTPCMGWCQYLSATIDGTYGVDILRDAERIGDDLFACGVSVNSGTIDGAAHCFSISETGDTLTLYHRGRESSILIGGYLDCNDTICVSAWQDIADTTAQITAFLAVFDHAGTLLWEQRYDSLKYRYAVNSVALTLSGILVSGFARDSSASRSDGFLSFHSTVDGKVLWSKSFTRSASRSTLANATLEHSSTTASVVFHEAEGSGTSRVFYTRWNLANGNLEHEETVDIGCAPTQIRDVEWLTDSSLLLTGNTICGSGITDALVVEIDTFGHVLWSSVLPNPKGTDIGYFIEVFSNYFFVGGVTVNDSINASDFDPLILKYQTDTRELLFSISVTPSMEIPNGRGDWVYGGTKSLEGGVCLVGYTKDIPDIKQVYSIACVDSVGCTVPNCISTIGDPIDHVSLNALSVYPSPAVTDELYVTSKQPIAVIQVIDPLGRIVFSDHLELVDTEYKLDTRQWRAGVHVLLVSSNDGRTYSQSVLR